jgi:hypothetical protein
MEYRGTMTCILYFATGFVTAFLVSVVGMLLIVSHQIRPPRKE